MYAASAARACIEQPIDAPPEKFDGLALQFKLPALIRLKYGLGASTKRAVIEKHDSRIEQKL